MKQCDGYLPAYSMESMGPCCRDGEECDGIDAEPDLHVNGWYLAMGDASTDW